MATTTETSNQYICTACGFNMIGFQPKRCRFCGATPNYFLTAEECSEKFKLQSTPINGKVTQLRSVPQLGYEHIAYCIKTSGATCSQPNKISCGENVKAEQAKIS